MAFDRQDTQDRIKVIIVEKLNVDAQAISPDSTLQDLGADSLDMVEIIMKIEEDFNIEINDEDAEKFHTLDQVIDYVNERRK